MLAFAPHLYFTQFYNDTIPEQREKGLEKGLAMLEKCEDYMGKILVMNYDALKPEYRSRPYQLGLATGGFGCSPTARGRRIFATSLYDGEQSDFYW